MCKNLGVNCQTSAKTERVQMLKYPDICCQVYVFSKSCNPESRCVASGKAFMFDSEHDELLKNAKSVDMYASILDYIVKHPVILFFVTNDERQLGLRFVTREEAVDFLTTLNYVDKLLNHPNLQSNRSKQSN